MTRAASLFAERGYPHVSLADIAGAAGVTAPSVYRHFDDKQALLAAAVLVGVDDLEACTDRALSGSNTSDDLVRAVCAMGVERPEAAYLWRWNSTYLTEDQNVTVADRTGEVLSRWAQALAHGRPELSERGALRLAWAVLSVSGSPSVHHSRMSTTRIRTELHSLITRLITLNPADAPPMTPPPSMPAGTRTRRDEILDAAASLFAARGYAAVGVDDIGAAVGITGPSVYKHFPSKLAILVGIGKRSAMRLEAGAMAAYSRTDRPDELLALLVDSYVATITATPDLLVTFNSSSVLEGQPGAVELIDLQRQYVARWIDLLMRTDVSLDRDQAALSVHAALSIVNDAVRMRRGSMTDRFVAQMTYLMQGVLGLISSSRPPSADTLPHDAPPHD